MPSVRPIIRGVYQKKGPRLLNLLNETSQSLCFFIISNSSRIRINMQWENNKNERKRPATFHVGTKARGTKSERYIQVCKYKYNSNKIRT